MKKLLTLACLMTSLQWQCFANTLNWSSPVSISTPNVNASDPQVAIDSNGNATSVWVESNIIQASHFPAGGSWGTITSISNTGASGPRVGIDSAGNLTAIWIENGVVSSATLPAGGSWSTETTISNTGASNASISVDNNGNAVAVWVRNGFIEASQKPFGSSWGNVSLLSSTGAETSPDVSIGANGTIIAVWHSVSSGADLVIYAKGSVGGSWGSQTSIIATTPAMHHNYPKVVVDLNGNAVAMWYRYGLSGSTYSSVQVLSSTLIAGSSTWGVPTLLSNPGMLNLANFAFSKIKTDAKGNIMAEWVNSYDGSTFNIESAVRPNTGTWNLGGLLDGTDPYAYQGSISVASTGDSVVNYMFFDGTNLTIQSIESCVQGIVFNFFTNPVTISQGTNNAYPKVASQSLNNQINAASVWLQNNGTNTTVQAVTGSKILVSPPSNLTVTQNSNNFGVFTENYNTLNWTASPDSDVIEYIIYRNGVVVQAVPASTLQFVDQNTPVASGSITYGVAALSSQLMVSPLVTAVE